MRQHVSVCLLLLLVVLSPFVHTCSVQQSPGDIKWSVCHMFNQQHTRERVFGNMQRELRLVPGAFHSPVCHVPLFRIMEQCRRNLQPHLRDSSHKPSEWSVLLPQHQRGHQCVSWNVQPRVPGIASNNMRHHWSLGFNVWIMFGNLLNTSRESCQRCLQLLKPICSHQCVSCHMPAGIFWQPSNNLLQHWNLGHYLWLLPGR